MFSGIRSILFGYSEPDNSVNNELISESESSTAASASAPSPASSCNKTTSKANEKSLSSDTSALLEQTLTAATTKFTEQLLLPSPSIEQLQSSSHQLLPTLTEQHEEETLRRNKQNQLLDDGANQPDDQDDECLDVDSWEMLDLVEKPQVSSVNSTVQGDSGDRSSGILKQAGTDSAVPQRQKPKVSFETPDLVSDKQKIESTNKPKDSPKPGSSRSRNKKKSKQTRVAAALPIAEQPTIEKASDGEKPAEEYQSTKDVEVVKTDEVQNAPQLTTGNLKQGDSKLPALNYAAALHKKKDGDEGSKVDNARPMEGSGEPKLATGSCIVGLQSAGPSKRNRPVSSSSWSSSDEIEAVDSVWNFGEEEPKQDDIFKKLHEETGPADHESMVSSGFSECEYGYGDLNDFYLRPRKGQNKRRGISANSNSLLTSMSKRGGERDQSKKQPESSTSSLCPKVTVVKGKVESLKSIKPKKKRMALTPSTRSDFLKKSSGLNGCGSVESASASGSSCVKPQVESESSFVRPLAPLAPSANNSGNDSSDLADMDESWYVTPPPCFTGANTLSATQPRAKEAARENALIENPAIYIASGSKHLESVAPSTKTSSSSNQTKPKAIVLKKVNKQNVAIGFSGKSDSRKKSTTTVISQPRVAKKQKAWDNKFIIDVWDEEQDDVDDFDNLFGSETNLPGTGKAKKSVKKKTIKETKPIEPALIDDEPTADSESDCSISLPTSVDISEKSSIELVLTEDLVPQVNDENALPTATLEPVSPSKKPTGERKVAMQVRPIEPERQPAWQLRKRRSKRRSLGAAPTNVGRKGKLAKESQTEQSGSMDTNASSSARSTPTLIDRIGSSIVANLTNLANGFPGGSIQMPPRAAIEEVEKLNQSVARGPAAESKLVARRRMSKNFMDRQNDCAKMGNSNRRSDRRVKMFSTLNGVSVNRKVHTSFH